MPRYFFHMLDGRAAIDTSGLILDNEIEVRAAAIRGAGEMLQDEGMNLWLGNEWSTTVVDEAGYILFSLRFSVDYPKRPPVLLS